jgi:hypothetical protein
MTDAEYERIFQALSEVPGLDTGHDFDVVIEGDEPDEDHLPSTIYIKFMSDEGVSDDANGTAFAAFLSAYGVEFDQHRARSLMIRDVPHFVLLMLSMEGD